MSSIKVQNPKVFISYAWGTEEHQERVRSFATDLLEDGIDVLLDQWNLKEGNDKYAYMERSVNDPSVTNVLILLDPQYAEKADNRSGGVGTETQIISAEIYNKVTQEKFLPVIFERDEHGNVSKPAYLKGTLHFDLSREDKYSKEYERLVRRLYGVEVYEKPELGNRPSWVELTPAIATVTRTAYHNIESISSDAVKTEKFIQYLGELRNKLTVYKVDSVEELKDDTAVSRYMNLQRIRDQFLQLIKYAVYIDNSAKYIADMLEESCEQLNEESGVLANLKRTLLHEMFIYVIAHFSKAKNYQALSHLLSKPYFVNQYSKASECYEVFYYYNDNLEQAVCQRDNKNYYSGTAALWTETINLNACSKGEFVFADILCYNVSLFGKYYPKSSNKWFPLTYIYGDEANRLIRLFSYKLQSNIFLHEAIQIFGYEDPAEFVERFKKVEEIANKGELRYMRYKSSFSSPSTLIDFVSSSELGISR